MYLIDGSELTKLGSIPECLNKKQIPKLNSDLIAIVLIYVLLLLI